MSKAKYFYVYAVINFEQRLAYIGSRGSIKLPENDVYMGSYDKKSGFVPTKKLILSKHLTRKEAYEAEREWQIKFDVAKSKLFVNKGIHTSSGFSMYGRKLEGKHREKSIEVLRKEVEKQSIFIKLKNIYTEEVKTFPSLTEASRKLNLSQGQLSQLIKKKILKTKDWCLAETDISLFDTSITLKNALTSEIVVFGSLDEAASRIGVERRSVLKVLNKKQISTNGYTLPDTDADSITLHKRKIRLMNGFTRKIIEFNSLTEAANFLGIRVVNLSKVLNKERPCTKGYVLAPENSEDFLDLEKRIKQAIKLIRQPKIISILDTDTNETYYFESQMAAATFLKCSPPLVGQLARGNFKRILGRYILAPESISIDS